MGVGCSREGTGDKMDTRGLSKIIFCLHMDTSSVRLLNINLAGKVTV